jgi:hypothetical protein
VPSVFIAAYFMLAYFGLLPLYYKLDPYRVTTGITDQQLIFKTLLMSGASIISICFGQLIISKILIVRESNNPYLVKGIGNRGLAVILIFFLFSVLIFFMYLMKLPGLPILGALKGDRYAADLVRSMIFHAFPGKYHYYSLFFAELLIFLTFVIFSASIYYKRIGFSILTFLMVCMAIFANIIDTQKAPFIFIIFGLFFTFAIAKNITFKLSYISKIIIPLIFFLLIAQIYLGGTRGRSLNDIVYMVVSRITASSGVPYYYLKMFPEHKEFLLGDSFPNPQGIFPHEVYELTKEIHRFIFQGYLDDDIVGSAPAVFWAELYANFFWPGVIILSIIVGMGIYFVHFFLKNLPHHIATPALISYCCIHYFKLSITGLGRFLFDERLFLILLAYFIIIFCDRKSGKNYIVDGVKIINANKGYVIKNPL